MNKFKTFGLLLLGTLSSCSNHYSLNEQEAKKSEVRHVKYVEEHCNYRDSYSKQKNTEAWKKAQKSSVSRAYLDHVASSITDSVMDSMRKAITENTNHVSKVQFPYPSESVKDQIKLLTSLRGKEESVINPNQKVYWVTPNDTLSKGYIESYKKRTVVRVFKNDAKLPYGTYKTYSVSDGSNYYKIVAYWKKN